MAQTHELIVKLQAINSVYALAEIEEQPESPPDSRLT